MIDKRITYRREGEGFVEINFSDLKEGDIFKLIDIRENPFETGDKIYKGVEEPTINKDKILYSIVLGGG